MTVFNWISHTFCCSSSAYGQCHDITSPISRKKISDKGDYEHMDRRCRNQLLSSTKGEIYQHSEGENMIHSDNTDRIKCGCLDQENCKLNHERIHDSILSDNSAENANGITSTSRMISRLDIPAQILIQEDYCVDDEDRHHSHSRQGRLKTSVHDSLTPCIKSYQKHQSNNEISPLSLPFKAPRGVRKEVELNETFDNITYLLKESFTQDIKEVSLNKDDDI